MFILILLFIVIVMIAVLIHYELLNFLSEALSRFKHRHRMLVIVGVGGSLFAHILEIVVFAIGYYGLINYVDEGMLQGSFDGSIFDCIYFSFTTFTTLGFGDIEPLGHLRILVGLEALTGLVLITWSASFMFIEMQKFWQKQ